MTTSTETKQERINLRLQCNAKKILARAAGFEGKSISRFILTSALARAEKTISKHETMKLNAQDSEAFFRALDRPAQFNEALNKALDIHDKQVISK